MTFQRTWTGRRKKEAPNKIRKKPTISFRCDLYNQSYLSKMKSINKRSEFINKSISSRIWLETNKSFFIRQIVRENYDLVRFILRQEGSKRGNQIKKMEEMKNAKI